MPVAARQKPPGQAVNRHPRLEFIEVPNIPAPGRPMPRRRGDKRWPAGCREAWKIWSTMPHVILWEPADWLFAEASLHILARAIEVTSDVKWFSELRYRERIMGCTHDSRRDLRIRYVDPPEQEAGPEVTKLDDYRNL